MKITVNLILLILLVVHAEQCTIGQNVKQEESKEIQTGQNYVKIDFNIIPDEIKLQKGSWEDEFEIKAEIKHTNLNKKDLTLKKLLFVGLETEGDNFIEAFDFEENKIEIERDMHYQIPFDANFENPYFEEMTLKTNESKMDTIDINTFYVFKEKGIFKVRFVSTELGFASNWDTLNVN